MSDYKVPYTTILNITPHSNAERLEMAWVYGFQVIVQKDRYKIGDKVLYIPVDSIITPELEAILFPEGSKIKLNNRRVRQIRIRGLASQGMLVNPNDLTPIFNMEYASLEQDLSAIFSITKYDPPVPGFAQTMGKDKQRNKRDDNPFFHKYNGLDNIKWFPDFFKEGEEVVIQEKLHGTNSRAGWLPFTTNTWIKKLNKFLGFSSSHEQCYGSNNVQLQERNNWWNFVSKYKGFYGKDIYGETLKKMDIFSKIKLNETVFGEIIGPSIQSGYSYGLTEPTFVLFDVKILNADGTQTWLEPDKVEEFAKERGFEYVPVLYKGPYNKEYVKTLSTGRSHYNPIEKVREGIVIKSRIDYTIEGNKRALKMISEDYLDNKNNTDFH